MSERAMKSCVIYPLTYSQFQVCVLHTNAVGEAVP